MLKETTCNSTNVGTRLVLKLKNKSFESRKRDLYFYTRVCFCKNLHYSVATNLGKKPSGVLCTEGLSSGNDKKGLTSGQNTSETLNIR